MQGDVEDDDHLWSGARRNGASRRRASKQQEVRSRGEQRVMQAREECWRESVRSSETILSVRKSRAMFTVGGG